MKSQTVNYLWKISIYDKISLNYQPPETQTAV